MGMWAHRHLFSHIAVVLIALFIAVLFMHAFIPHEHEHEAFGTGIILPVHNATGEKFFTLTLPTSLFIAFSTILFTRNIFLEIKLRGRKQFKDNQSLHFHQRLFARGILHSKTH